MYFGLEFSKLWSLNHICSTISKNHIACVTNNNTHSIICYTYKKANFFFQNKYSSKHLFIILGNKTGIVGLV